MASTVTRSFYRVMKSCGNLQRCNNFTKRLEFSTINVSSLAISSHQSLSILGNTSNRALWYLSTNYVTRNSPTSCTYGKFHTQSDSTFSQLLSEEINGEKERMLNIPKSSFGWTMKQDGSDCKLVKNLDNDSIEVSFNVNGSVPPASSEDPEEEQDIIAQPDFMVEIKKPSISNSLSFECYFPDDDGEEHSNIFSIRSVILHKGEMTETTYVIDTDNIDPNLYGHMLTYLEERGVNNDFADELINIATAIENQQYIGTLEKLQKFVGSK